MEMSLDESDNTDYSDLDYVPDSEAGCYSETEDETPQHPVTKKPMRSLQYPILSIIDSVSSPIKVLAPSNAETRRVYNKINCLFCLKPTSKFARHLEAVHGNEAEVALAFQHPKNSKERRKK